MGIPNRRRLEALRDGDPLRDWLLDYLKKHHEGLPFLDLIAENSARKVALAGLRTEAHRHAFFDRYYREIEVIWTAMNSTERAEAFDGNGADVRSVLVWVAIEETVRGLRFELYDHGRLLPL